MFLTSVSLFHQSTWTLTFLAQRLLSCPEIISYSQSGLGFFSQWQFIQGPQRRYESCINLHLGWLFFVPTEYMDGCAHSLTHKPEEETCKGPCEEEVICCGAINGHYSLPRCIRFASHWLLKEPRLSFTNWSQTSTKQHAPLYLKISGIFVS